jgi:hypothetical protein
MLGITLIFITAVITYLTVFILHLHIVHRRRYADLTVVDNFITFELHRSANKNPRPFVPPPPYNRTPRRQRQQN